MRDDPTRPRERRQDSIWSLAPGQKRPTGCDRGGCTERCREHTDAVRFGVLLSPGGQPRQGTDKEDNGKRGTAASHCHSRETRGTVVDRSRNRYGNLLSRGRRGPSAFVKNPRQLEPCNTSSRRPESGLVPGEMH